MVLSVKFLQELANKGCLGYKGCANVLADVKGSILKAVIRGGKSKHCIDTSVDKYSDRIFQTFKMKNGGVIKKVYSPQNGTIDTAVFKGDKARLINQDSYYSGITQPDKLINQHWLGDVEPEFNFHSLSITKPTKPNTPYGITRGIHVPQRTTELTLEGHSGGYNSFPSRLDSGVWYRPGGPVTL